MHDEPHLPPTIRGEWDANIRISRRTLNKRRLSNRVVADPQYRPFPLSNNGKKRKNSHDILLIGYLGGGTSFTGDILGKRNDSFYLYEPLYSLYRFGYFKPDYSCSMKKESCRRRNATNSQVLERVQALFNCEYGQYVHDVNWWQILKSGGAEKVNDRHWKISPHCKGICLMKYINLCSKDDSIVSKIPRISISLASKILNKLPNLKIIHLLRDPRAIMNSRKKYDWTPVPGGAISLCNKMTDDFRESHEVKILYPGRLLTVFYEDMVTDPLKTIGAMYNFSGYDFDADERHRILDQIRNSSKIATAWRTRIHDDVLTETNKACAHLYPVFGYPQFVNRMEINDTNIPLRMKTTGREFPTISPNKSKDR
ncbi:carbohydrate sulfotransferase 1-like [Ylistrum balloti]|uniref:carbohydrate sulfotransferase 1-like n=1 Tax=Ylistrum balloti TaxID=509963 RepID=UPI002905A4B9|nr:carbohydrate sulfotransferase 1-like [Ylistrum balloti]